MNGNDIFILLGLTAITAIGFFNGTIRLMISVISFYMAIVLAGLYYRIVGVWLTQRLETSPQTAPAIAFGLILLVAFAVLLIALIYTFRYAQTPRSLQIIDRLLGAVLGLVLGALIVGMYATIMRFIFIDQRFDSVLPYPILRAIGSSVRTSFMLGFFLNEVLPLIFRTLDPVLPDEANIIFNIR